MKLAVYDLEIKNQIPGPFADPDIPVCKGWTDYKGMGISCGAVTYGTMTENTTVYSQSGAEILSLLKQLQKSGHLVGGFNNFMFDDRLLSSTEGQFRSNFDLLERVRFYAPRVKGYKYSLKAILEANDLKKVDIGYNAPKLYHRNELEKLKTYVISDSESTYKVLILGLTGRLRNPNTNQRIKIWI